MSSILNVWSVSGAAIGGVGSLLSTAFTKSVSGEGTVGVGIMAVVIGGGLGLGAESIYHHWTEPTPITSQSCANSAPRNSNYEFKVVNGVPSCTYSPKQ